MAWPDTTVGQFVQLQMQGTLWTGQAWRNSYHLWGHDAASPVEVADLTGLLASAAIDDLIAKYQAVMESDSTVDGVLARQVADPLAPSDVKNEAFRTVGLAGTLGVSAHCPAEISMLMKLGSDAAGKSAHGWVFLPWDYDRDGMSSELFDATRVTRANGIRDSILKFSYTSGAKWGGAAADFDLALYSATRRSRNLDQYGYRVISATVPRRIHWLRSRGRGTT